MVWRGDLIFDENTGDLLTESLSRMEDSACLALALAKEKQTNRMQVIYVDKDGNDALISIYDWKYHVWKSSDTLDLLAESYLGSADYADVIAYYNNISNESALPAGVKIKIPSLSENESNANNKIYAEPERQDNYGSDIEIGEDGDFAVFAGDFGTLSGKKNLAQAVLMRLTTAGKKRIRLTSYGIRSTVGDTLAVESYLTSAIMQSVMADPRIASLNEISFTGDGDKLHLLISYHDINGDTGVFEGEI